MAPRTRLDSAEHEASEYAKAVGGDGSEKGMSRTCVGSSFEKSTHSQCREARLKLPLIPNRGESEHRRAQEQKVPGAVKSPE